MAHTSKGGSKQETVCRLCGNDSYGFIRIPNTLHDVCKPCGFLIVDEMRKLDIHV